ncbi:MAG: alpha/beta hydrolase [Candidatus Izemoplasmatales bacterium]|nr:alpha/beta hydrolase [Candidatus Izemoplasmatales bacterium]
MKRGFIMERYQYSNALRGPKLGIGNLKLTNPLLRLFFWINDFKGKIFKPILNTTKTKILVKGYEDAVLNCYVINPDRLDTNAPTIIYLHGGGFFGGFAPINFINACFYANELKCRVFLPEYRTSYKYKYPIPVEDCYEATKFIYDNAKTLMVNNNRFVVYGDSAGGCLAAAVSLMARDRKTFSIAMQMLIYPVTDYLQLGKSLKTYPLATWSTAATRRMWKLYLGKVNPINIGYASPLYADSLNNLPFAYVEPQEIDCLCDEGIAFAKRLEASKVATILNVIKGSYHAFEEEYPNLFVLNILHQRCDQLRKTPYLK